MPTVKGLLATRVCSQSSRGFGIWALGFGIRAASMVFPMSTPAAEQSRLPLRVAILGFGTVGSSVARILVERPELESRLQLTHVFNRDVARKVAPWVRSS